MGQVIGYQTVPHVFEYYYKMTRGSTICQSYLAESILSKAYLRFCGHLVSAYVNFILQIRKSDVRWLPVCCWFSTLKLFQVSIKTLAVGRDVRYQINK